VQYKADEFVSYLYFRVKFDPDKVEVVSIDRKPVPNSLWTWDITQHGLYTELPPTPGLLEFAAVQFVPGRVIQTDYYSIARITFRDISGTMQVVPLKIDFVRAGSRLRYAEDGGQDPYTGENEGTSYFLLEPINGAMIIRDPEFKGVDCDFNQDSRIDIADIIALLLFLRDNPDDLRGDFNGDGSTGVADAITMVNAQRHGTCPDAGVLLSSAIEDAYLLVTGRLDNLTVKDIGYIEKIMVQLDLTGEEEAAFRLALYGGAAGPSLPRAFSLSQNVPNPFNPSTTISYSVPEEKGMVRVSLKVYNLRGQLVRTLVDEVQEAGGYNVFWDGRNDTGRQVASGIYMYRMQAGEFVQTRKMVLLK
jgi:hypothetical protein